MLPDAGQALSCRWQVINEEPVQPRRVYYGAGSHTLTKEGIGNAIRQFVVGAHGGSIRQNPQDVQQVHALAGRPQGETAKSRYIRNPQLGWRQASRKVTWPRFLQLGETISDTKRMFGAKDQVDSGASSGRKPH